MMVNPDQELEVRQPDISIRPPEPRKDLKNPRCKKCKHYLTSHAKSGCVVEVGLYSHKECGCMWSDHN